MPGVVVRNNVYIKYTDLGVLKELHKYKFSPQFQKLSALLEIISFLFMIM